MTSLSLDEFFDKPEEWVNDILLSYNENVYDNLANKQLRALDIVYRSGNLNKIAEVYMSTPEFIQLLKADPAYLINELRKQEYQFDKPIYRKHNLVLKIIDPDNIVKHVNDRKERVKSLLNIRELNITTNYPRILHYFTKLTNLSLRIINKENIVELSNFTKLTKLSLWDNKLEDISALHNLTKLTKLSLWYNNLEDISALSNLSNLTDLDLSHNKLKILSALSKLTNLTVLRANNNELEDISALSNLSNLTDLNLDNNKLEDISALRNLSNLTTLSYTNNNLPNELYADGNSIQSIQKYYQGRMTKSAY